MRGHWRFSSNFSLIALLVEISLAGLIANFRYPVYIFFLRFCGCKRQSPDLKNLRSGTSEKIMISSGIVESLSISKGRTDTCMYI